MLGAEAKAAGRGGVSAVVRATGSSFRTVSRAVAELSGTEPLAEGRIRKAGGGRKPIEELHPEVLDALDYLLEPLTRGDPESPLRWTCKSTRALAAELREQGFDIHHVKVSELLAANGYSLQANRKVIEGGDHPDRNAQFEHINAQAAAFQAAGDPVISVDAKKKELVGNYKNGGREWHVKGDAPKVGVYDFIGELGKVTPYGVYDLGRNEAWVSVGTDHDTAAFAVASIRTWWMTMGKPAYPQAKRLLINADGGGSNGSRNRLWKVELQRFANETGLEITVSHFPPGTSKWNKIEHRLFSRISQNWRGRPLTDHETIIGLIGSTTSQSGLVVRAGLDTGSYPTGLKTSDAQMDSVSIARDMFHGEWDDFWDRRAAA